MSKLRFHASPEQVAALNQTGFLDGAVTGFELELAIDPVG